MNNSIRVIKNPLFIILPVIALLLFAWYQYTSAESQINISRANILPNAGLDQLDDHGLPVGWQFSPASAQVTATSIAGYESPRLLVLTNSGDSSTSNTTLTSPLVSVEKEKTYLYKGFYRSTISFDLIIQSNYRDGSKKLEIIKRYNSNKQWATVSHLFTATANIQSVQFVYSFAAKGELQIDDNYLEANPREVYSAPAPALGNNLLPVVTPASDAWSNYASGDNKTTSRRITDDGSPYLHSQVIAYKGGEAKWQHDPLPVRGNRAFWFSANYRSDAPVDVIAEYILASGQREFYTIGTLLPAKDWTIYTGEFETPSNATSVVVSLVLHQNGTLDTKDYGLYDISKPGAAAWQRPLASITFDDGWKSAYVNGVPLLKQYGYAATFYLNPAAIDTANFMDSNDVTTLSKEGHELASHGYQHHDFTTLDKQSIDYQLRYAYDYFKQIHNQPVVHFSAPFGGTDSQVSYYAHKYYASLRGTESGINTRQNFDPYNLLVLYVGNDTPSAKIASALAEAEATNGWLILVYHRVDTITEGEPVIAPAQFQQQLDAIKKSGVTVTPVGSALQELSRQ